MKTINKLQIVTLLTSVIFVLFVSLPAIFTGIELFSINEDIHHYNAQQIKTDEMTELISLDFDSREALTASSHPLVAFMAQHSSAVWVSVTVLFGVLPIVYFRQIARWIYRKVLILYATRNNKKIIKRI